LQTDPTQGWGIVTGEAVALDIHPARLGSRLLAKILDLLVQIALLIVLSLVLSSPDDSAAAAAMALAVSVLVLVGYPLVSETLWRGRTLGKAALGLRVVRDDGGPIRFRHALVRALVGAFVDFGITVGAGAVICSLLHPDGKRIGDVAAGTLVIQERIPSHAGAVAQMPPPLAGWAASADLSGVSPQLAASARQLIARQSELHPQALEELGSRVVAALSAAVSPPPPPGTPGWALVQAVLAERRRREEQA
jgi:uncharacterized RDD family membrane protein YckC